MNLLLNINGTVGRGGWWLGQFINIALLFVALTIIATSGDVDFAEKYWILEALVNHPSVLFLFGLMLWINICLTVKRYRDIGKSGWWFLVAFMPYVGLLWQCTECGFVRGKSAAISYSGGGHTYNGDEPDETNSAIDDQIAAMVLKNKQAERSNAEPQPVRNSRPSHVQSFGNAAAPVFGKR